jgi:hypothetical protein
MLHAACCMQHAASSILHYIACMLHQIVWYNREQDNKRLPAVKRIGTATRELELVFAILLALAIASSRNILSQPRRHDLSW